jgi:diacylglycerol kinase (ATP)
MQRKKMLGLGRMLRAFASSAKGFVGAWREEQAFRQEIGFACIALPAAVWLGHSGAERALLAGPVLLILIVELLNSALEATVDRIGLERHVLAGLAKDIGSAAVMLSFILLAVIWLLVLVDR